MFILCLVRPAVGCASRRTLGPFWKRILNANWLSCARRCMPPRKCGHPVRNCCAARSEVNWFGVVRALTQVRATKRIAGCPSCGGHRTVSSRTGACAQGRSQEVPARWALVALRERGQPAKAGLPLRVKPSHTAACEELHFFIARALPRLSDGSNREHCGHVGT
jgi:hypothetical protein